MTDDVNSGRKLTALPPGSVKVYNRPASSPPAFRTKSSVSSNNGVSIGA